MSGAHCLRYTDDQIREAGRLLLQGMTYQQAARRLGMYPRYLEKIANGQGGRWQLLEEIGWDVRARGRRRRDRGGKV